MSSFKSILLLFLCINIRSAFAAPQIDFSSPYGRPEGGYGAFAEHRVNSPPLQEQHQNQMPQRQDHQTFHEQQPPREGANNGQHGPGQDRSLGLILSGVSGAMRGVGRYVMGGGMMGGGMMNGGMMNGGYGVSAVYNPYYPYWVC